MVIRFVPEICKGVNFTASQKNMGALKRTTFRRPSEECRQVLDIGCGTGDFTRDVLLPWIHPCSKVVATDVSSTMVDCAKIHFGHPAIRYDVLHLGNHDVSGFANNYGRFDRIYSFLCWHWIRDQEAAFRNVSGLSKDEGESLLVFCGPFFLYDVWTEMAGMDRWKYIIDDPTASFPDIWQREPRPSLGDIEKSVRKLIANAGMSALACDFDQSDSEYRSEEEVIALLASSVTVQPGTPREQEARTREELAVRMLGRCTRTPTSVTFPTDLFIVHTQKK